LDYLDPSWSRLGLFGFNLDYLDSTILWLGLDLDYLDPIWSRLGLFGFDLDYLDSTILWLGLDLDYLDSTWIIWIRRFLPWSRLGLFGFDLDYLDSTWIIWIRLALFYSFWHILNTCPRSVSEPSTIPGLLGFLSIWPSTPVPRTPPRSQQAWPRIYEAPNTMLALRLLITCTERKSIYFVKSAKGSLFLRK
jgi:hypothetical protein